MDINQDDITNNHQNIQHNDEITAPSSSTRDPHTQEHQHQQHQHDQQPPQPPSSAAATQSQPSTQTPQTNSTNTATTPAFSFVVGPDGRLVPSPDTTAPSPGLAHIFQSIFNMMTFPIPLADPPDRQNNPSATPLQPPSVPGSAVADNPNGPPEPTTPQPPQPPQLGLALSISFGFSRERDRNSDHPQQAQAPTSSGLYPLLSAPDGRLADRFTSPFRPATFTS